MSGPSEAGGEILGGASSFTPATTRAEHDICERADERIEPGGIAASTAYPSE